LHDVRIAARSTSANRSPRPRLKFLRSLVFFPMLWLRTLILGLMRLVGGLCSLAGVIVFIASAFSKYQNWLLGCALLALSFFSFMVRYFYDSLLLRLNPTDRVFLLY
jgi:hypothetical protein